MAGRTRAGDSYAPSVVVLAAGAGTRFGGRKQLAEVGAPGETIMDIVVRRAAAAGLARAVIVVAPEIVQAVRDHLDARADAGIPIEVVVQRSVPGHSKPLGTAAAVLAAADAIEGTFVVVNGDDLYPVDAFALLTDHLRNAPVDEHALVAFRVANTLTGDRSVSRAVIDIGPQAQLLAVREGSVVRGREGLRFETETSVQPLTDDTPVSMNMWGFRASVLGAFADAVEDFVASGRAGEVFLPDVVTSLVRSGAVVRVLVSEGTCIGVTHPEDVVAVRNALS
ncbi:MAG: MobA-like transferase domain protein [Actinomycetia bacterium]|jgi:NDP-sugar pyrophosphorylase family protein|nr:MobA-like transferase domain protein [Actinomycetes bacterium]